MFKRILIAVLAAQLVITPVQAKQECTKAFVGIDDIIMIAISTYLIISSLTAVANRRKSEAENEKLKKELEQERAKQPAANTCLM